MFWFGTSRKMIQRRRAERPTLIERRLSERNPGFISVVAIVETVSVLERAYGFASDKIAQAIERTLAIEWLIVEDEQEVFATMVALKEGRSSFADALIAALGVRAGCSQTFTFDRKALRLPGLELL